MLDRRTFLLGSVGAAGGLALLAEDEQTSYAKSLYATGMPRTTMFGSFDGVVMDLPPEMRTRNWGGGSCVHASTVNLLLQMGLDEMARWWRANYSGGEYDSRLIRRMEAAGLRYAYTHGDPEFLNWCWRTRRGAGVFYKPSHSINFVGRDQTYAYLLDNNATSYPEAYGHYERVEWNRFVSAWHGYGGFAWTLVYQPPPATPLY